MTEDYCKLVSGIILSTVWREDDHTRILWITMLAVKNRRHEVLASVPGLAAVANIPLESCRASLRKLQTPDPDSRTKDHEGRRIEEIDGGWLVLNGEKYRNFLAKAEKNEYQAKLMAERRSTGKMKKLAHVSQKLGVLAQAEAEAEAEAEKEKEIPPVPPKGGRKRERFVPPPVPDSLQSDGFPDAWAQWVPFRLKLKRVASPGPMFAKQLAMLAEHPPKEAAEIINRSIRNGWQGLFPEHIAGTTNSVPRKSFQQLEEERQQRIRMLDNRYNLLRLDLPRKRMDEIDTTADVAEMKEIRKELGYEPSR